MKLILFVLIQISYNVQISHLSLLSRMKNPHHYSATSEVLSQDYEDEEFRKNSAYDQIFTSISPEWSNTEAEKPQTKFFEHYNLNQFWDQSPRKILLPSDFQSRYRNYTYSNGIESGLTKEILLFRPTQGIHSSFVSEVRINDDNNSEILVYRPTIASSESVSAHFLNKKKTLRSYFPTRSYKIHEIFENPDYGHKTGLETVNDFYHFKQRNFKIAHTDYELSKTTTLPEADMNFLKITIPESINRNTEISRAKFEARALPVVAFLRRANSTARCYTCGMNNTGLSNETCFDIFERGDESEKYLMRKYRTKCNGSTFIGGCFKRYLDVGHDYNERGCRTMPPMMGKSYASKRLMSLEYVLHTQTDGCVGSPHAVLTPFSRAISLFVRYYVCVCSTRYCNKATKNSSYFSLYISMYILLYLFIK